ncbi:hypothetical protein [Marinobacter sp. AL4B]|uniref:hypothetical protein n=1 Tax=Marinobacter sp. AL4B TaxID=2871173 RepID=UPI001CAA6CDD|nr:hypothetical protein [Marinobacter sp. AL4B]MBZ0333218.1 hypothetical protein [Marinobacter sp. AL4B]
MLALNSYLRKVIGTVLEFCSVSGAAFVVGCGALAVSRVCQVMAFFLPLKIFIVLSSGEVPVYFDFFPEEMEFQEIVLLLAGMVPVVYGLFIVLGILHRWLIDRHLTRFGSRELNIEGTKIPEKKMKRIHNHVSKAFSEVGLVVVSVLFGFILDPMVAVAWIVILYVNLWIFYSKVFHVEDHHRVTFLKLHRRQFIEYISSSNFLIVFAVLTIEMAYFDMGVYTGIFLLLVSRMVFQALNRFSVESLYILKLFP